MRVVGLHVPAIDLMMTHLTVDCCVVVAKPTMQRTPGSDVFEIVVTSRVAIVKDVLDGENAYVLLPRAREPIHINISTVVDSTDKIGFLHIEAAVKNRRLIVAWRHGGDAPFETYTLRPAQVRFLIALIEGKPPSKRMSASDLAVYLMRIWEEHVARHPDSSSGDEEEADNCDVYDDA
jgi:hypothetical protein